MSAATKNSASRRTHAEDLDALQQRLEYTFNDLTLLERAITHNSWAVEAGTESNQTLEFLGDAVVDLVVTELIMAAHGNCNEGEMTRIRASIVSSTGLAKQAHELELGGWVRLGVGEQRSGGRSKGRILADTYEALIGAIFLDGGYEPARKVVTQHLGQRVLDAEASESDHKTGLQELAQQISGRPPSYSILDITGPDHERHYRVEIRLDGESLATGDGPNRKSAEQMAASAATEVLRARIANSEEKKTTSMPESEQLSIQPSEHLGDGDNDV